MPWSLDLQEFVVRCKQYRKGREHGVKPPPLDEHILPNGLYPGQLSEPEEPKEAEEAEACLT
jgi:hypothetical protein